MNYAKMNVALILFICSTCQGFFWNSHDTRVINPTVPAPTVPTPSQNLVVYYNPVQFNTPIELPSGLLSRLPLKEWQNKTSSFIFRQRYFIGASLLLGGYIYVCSYIVQANKYLERPDTWNSWRADMPFDLLVTIPQHELAKDLILEIQRKYSNTQNPTDFISPLISFVQTIDKEINTLKKFIDAYWLITKLHVEKLLPVNIKQFATLNERYKKLLYLKNVFLSWAAEYKVNHNKNKRFMPAYEMA